MFGIQFENSILQTDPERRALILPVFEAALSAVDPAVAVHKTLVLDRAYLRVGDTTYDLDGFRHVYGVGFGKAVTPMAEAVLEILGDRVHAGAVITNMARSGRQCGNEADRDLGIGAFGARRGLTQCDAIGR